MKWILAPGMKYVIRMRNNVKLPLWPSCTRCRSPSRSRPAASGMAVSRRGWIAFTYALAWYVGFGTRCSAGGEDRAQHRRA